ncbi:MAG: hypothetical protein LBF67_05005 [Prevotellaceae bacterium]|nr:hypothetical protein [Prevotellaceae bacterium]
MLKKSGLIDEVVSSREALRREYLEQHLGKDAAQRFMVALHGSPYYFKKFSLSKIGTGEGAQRYG